MASLANNTNATAAGSRSNLQQNSQNSQDDRVNADAGTSSANAVSTAAASCTTTTNIPLENAQCQRTTHNIRERFSSSDSVDELKEIDWNASGYDISTSKATKTHGGAQEETRDVDDERDRYSPLRYPLSLPISQSHNIDYNDDEDDSQHPTNILTGIPPRRPNDNGGGSSNGNGSACGRISSKEEKQRQNEEKKTPASTSTSMNTDPTLSMFGMESSSISSETGSWEAVYPPRKQSASKSTNYSDKTPEQMQQLTRTNSGGGGGAGGANNNERNLTCFIDASTLLDDADISYTNNTFKSNAASNANECDSNTNSMSSSVAAAATSFEPNIGDRMLAKHNYDSKNTGSDRTMNETNTQQIYVRMDHASPSTQQNSATEIKKSKENLVEEFDRDEAEPLVINLSDEQKLSGQKSLDMNMVNAAHQQQRSTDIKDQYSMESTSTNGPKPLSLNMLNDAKSGAPTPPPTAAVQQSQSSDRSQSENERKQGHFLFSNSIQQFSGHAMSPKVPYFEENQSDFSLPSIYSGGSDCTFDTSSHISSDRDSHDFGELSNYPIANSSSKGDSSAVIFPDTPHNSILQVNVSRNSLGPIDSAIASLSSSESNAISIPPSCRPRAHDDTVPILSGGASVKDFTPKQCDSPLMQRKTENCPIISVGMSAQDFDEQKPKPKERQTNLSINSWVVDMSDCGKKGRRRGSESSSISVESNRFSDSRPDRSGSGSSCKGFGYYVSLADMKPSYLADDQHLSKSLNYHSSSSSCASAEPRRKKSTGFFVDFSNNDSCATSTPPSNNESLDRAQKIEDKKNIFSMFIDFGGGNGDQQHRSTPKRELNSKLAKQGSDTNSIESPLLSRRNHAPYNNSNNSEQASDSENKRHSWNASKELQSHAREHKRSVSTSSDKGIMNILDKIPLISKTSSMSIDTPNSPHDDITSKSLSSYSNNSLTSLSVQSTGSKFADHDDNKGGCGGNNGGSGGSGKRHQKDARINETFDKSSQGSLTDDILSKNSSPPSNTDTDDATFHNDNDEITLHGDISISNVMETIPETKEAVVLRRHQSAAAAHQSKMERHTMESLQATIEKQKQLLNTVSEEVSSFVKLSDMDKPAPKFELHNADNRPKSVGSRIGKLFDNRAGNRNTWHHMSKSTGNNLSNLASSAENFKSLTRIFPHLGKDLSNSLPTNFDQSTSNTSPNEYTMDLFHSDFSTSSATSSISRSGIDSADEFSLSAAQPQKLGADLLKMFLQEIATDVTIEVNGRRMRAHKCILRSRCQYFAAILAGGWVESAGNVISLSGYSYGSVHFALCHIYSGASHPPDGISLMELAALADLLGLEGLKEVAAHALKTNYCHSFHKPCSGCIDGVLQVFPVALNQGLDDLYRKCLRWACKHYMKVWPSRAFSQLPSELVARCKQHIIAHMTSESCLYTLLDCDHLLALLAPCRWATAVETAVRDIIEAGHVYVTDHYASLIASDGFLSLGQGQSWNISRLENMLLRAGSSLTPDQACRSYQRVTRLDSVLKAKVNKLHTSRIDKSIFMSDYDNEIDGDDEEELDWNPDFIRLVSEMIAAVETCLVRQCSRAMKSNQWSRMDVELQKKVQKLACLTEPVERRVNVRPKPASNANIVPNNRAHDLYQVKMAIQAHNKRSQEGFASIKVAPPPPQHVNEPKMASGPVKLTKSASARAQVPDLISTIKQPKSNVVSSSVAKQQQQQQQHHQQSEAKPKPKPIPAYRRSVSESSKRRIPIEKSSSSIETHVSKSKYSEVKSRYMEPKRHIEPMNNKDTLKIRARSSSGSSRTSSPMISSLIRDGHSNRKSIGDSTTISRDSLASPAKRGGDKSSHSNRTQSQHGGGGGSGGVGIDHERLSADSLGGSLHSSVITNKTISQESLVKCDTRAPRSRETRSNIQKNRNCNDENDPKKSMMKTAPGGAAAFAPLVNGKNAQLKVCSTLISQTSSTVNSSTPSSMTVKSYLSSSNSINSPRDAIVNRLTTPAHQIPLRRCAEPKPTVKSFLSARSRQILAQKKSLSHSDSSKSVPAIIKETPAPVSASVVNKSNSTSNILNQKSKNSPTTPTARRSTRLSTVQQPPLSLPPVQNVPKPAGRSIPSLMNPTKSSAMKMSTSNQKSGARDDRENGPPVARERKTQQQKQPNLDAQQSYNDNHNNVNEPAAVNAEIPPRRIESKLERSSTFCKERSDINTNELEVID